MTDLIKLELKPAISGIPAEECTIEVGKSVHDMVIETYGSDIGIKAWIRKGDSWEEVPWDQWRHVRPKKDCTLRFTYRVHNLGNVFGALISVFAPSLSRALFGSLGSLAVSLGTVAITAGASYLARSLFRPEVQQRDNAIESEAFVNVTSDANLLAKGAYLPIVIGVRRISPPDVMQPLVRIQDGIETIRRELALEGKHEIRSVQIDGLSFDATEAITTQIVDGDEATPNHTFNTEIGGARLINNELTTFRTTVGSPGIGHRALEDQARPQNSEPRWETFATGNHEALSEIAITFSTEGFLSTENSTEEVRIPLRVQFRQSGTDEWNSLPEMHIVGRETARRIKQLRFRWDDNFGVSEPEGDLRITFITTAPATHDSRLFLSDGNQNTVQWQSHSAFVDLDSANDTRNIMQSRAGINVQLSEDIHPKGAYEFRIIRGMALESHVTYGVGGTRGNNRTSDLEGVQSFFVSKRIDNVGDWQVPYDQRYFQGRITIESAAIIADREPVSWPEAAKIALSSRGQDLRQISCVAGREVMDWDGMGWNAPTTRSRNPATHFRQLLVNHFERSGISLDKIDNDSFVAWRTECEARGWECSMVAAGEPLSQTLQAIATAGYAQARISDQFGITYFRDTRRDMPVQTFSNRNTSRISSAIARPERPLGYRCGFQDRNNAWRDNEIIVTIDNAANVNELQARRFRSIDTEDGVRRRAYFDLLRLKERRRVWEVHTAIEGVLCENGDLVSLVTNQSNDENHGARILEVIDDRTFKIDQNIPVETVIYQSGSGTPATINQLFKVGETSRILLSRNTALIERTIEQVDTENGIIVLDQRINSPQNLVGAHVNIFTESNTTHRCFVLSITRTGEKTATLRLVEEAPQIWEKMVERFPNILVGGGHFSDDFDATFD